MSTRSLSVSVVVISFNRRDMLSKCLSALRKQSVRPDEVLVVVDGSTDGTNEMLTAGGFGDLPLHIISKPNEGRSRSRNLGAQKASGNILIFFDDDMSPHNGCVEEHLKIVGDDMNAVSVGTQEEDPTQIVNDFDHFRHYVTLKWEDILLRGDHKTYLTAANFSISKEAFMALNGFDSRTEVTEDVDLSLRAAARGMRIVYNRGARAWHDNKVDCKTFIRKQIEYHRSYLNLLTLHPEYSTASPSAAVYHPGMFKKIVYGFVSQQFFVGLVDREFFRYLLPKGVRYKFYDVLITGLAKVYPSRFNLQAIQYHG